ncbi:hypothetical protein PYCCODRAFT_1035600 [Trametes coccinea BRFM310]|uniref:Uncharacterized protein n=1 Tax=Trametes coccinea (strain BRFM310) TaxID=1353009 RepID=A0A1Y2IAG1_TRAC3|nr:hypothetical protein PYCCODRAFT_1035600 [Trametes coccinea BRFM310]
MYSLNAMQPAWRRSYGELCPCQGSGDNVEDLALEDPGLPRRQPEEPPTSSRPPRSVNSSASTTSVSPTTAESMQHLGAGDADMAHRDRAIPGPRPVHALYIASHGVSLRSKTPEGLYCTTVHLPQPFLAVAPLRSPVNDRHASCTPSQRGGTAPHTWSTRSLPVELALVGVDSSGSLHPLDGGVKVIASQSFALDEEWTVPSEIAGSTMAEDTLAQPTSEDGHVYSSIWSESSAHSSRPWGVQRNGRLKSSATSPLRPSASYQTRNPVLSISTRTLLFVGLFLLLGMGLGWIYDRT